MLKTTGRLETSVSVTEWQSAENENANDGGRPQRGFDVGRAVGLKWKHQNTFLVESRLKKWLLWPRVVQMNPLFIPSSAGPPALVDAVSPQTCKLSLLMTSTSITSLGAFFSAFDKNKREVGRILIISSQNSFYLVGLCRKESLWIGHELNVSVKATVPSLVLLGVFSC